MNELVVKAAGDLISRLVKRFVKDTPAEEEHFSPKIDTHLRWAANWSNRTQFMGMSKAEETEKATVALRLTPEPRRFRGRLATIDKSETDLLADSRNYILLGDPGAGKTTTLKRVIQRLLLEDAATEEDIYQFPIVIRLRLLDTDETIYQAIATTIGLPYHRRQKSEKEWYPGFWIGKTQLESAIVEFLNVSRVILLLDGLDEVHAVSNDRIRRELSSLALNGDNCKIVVSCRTGDYVSMIEGFDLMEICPLDKGEIAAIATAWLDDPQPFLTELQAVPYSDIADRPLLLTQLLYLYQRYEYLPDQPSQVYRPGRRRF